MSTVYPLPPPRGLQIKLSRARKQLRQLNRSFNRFASRNPGTFTSDVNPQGTHRIYRFRFAEGPDILQFLADEATYHLRSVLDHLLTALVESSGGDSSFRQYPILLKEPKTSKAIKAFEFHLGGIPPHARTLIIDNQPYSRGDGAEFHPLWILSRLNNRFKHTSMHLLSVRVGAPVLAGVIRHPGVLHESGDIFAEVPVSIDAEKDFEPLISAHIGFQAARIGVEGVDLKTLYGIYDFVRDEIVGKCVRLRRVESLSSTLG